jgi:hypothetical protein
MHKHQYSPRDLNLLSPLSFDCAGPAAPFESHFASLHVIKIIETLSRSGQNGGDQMLRSVVGCRCSKLSGNPVSRQKLMG